MLKKKRNENMADRKKYFAEYYQKHKMRYTKVEVINQKIMLDENIKFLSWNLKQGAIFTATRSWEVKVKGQIRKYYRATADNVFWFTFSSKQIHII